VTFIGSARKWRPQRFEELIGQEHIRRTLTNALGAGRVASAYLFSGTRGVGKTTTARILAKALNCESGEGPVAEPCNACGSCGEITRGAHPDVLEIDGATYTGVDNVRELREGLAFRPARGRYKTVIIDEVHMLSRGAFNALLKTLEEPPPHVVFVFATTELHKVPETILSRCQVFEFRRIAVSLIADQLGRILGEQGREVDEGALRLIARLGEGSMRDAQSLLDQVLAFAAEGRLTTEEVAGVLGVPSAEVYRSIVAAVADRDGRAALAELGRIYEAGHDMRLFCGNLLEFLRDCMVLQVAGDGGDLFDVGAAEIEERRALAGRLSFAEAQQAYAILQNAEAELRLSDHPRMTLELALMRMCQIEPLAELGGLIDRLESMGPGPGAGDAPAARGSSRPAGRPAEASGPPASGPRAQAPPAGAAGAEGPRASAQAAEAPPWDPVEARRAWSEAVQTLRTTRRHLLLEAEIDLETAGEVRVRVPPANGHAQTIDLIREILPSLEAHFASHAPWPIRVVIDAPDAAPGPAAPAGGGEGRDRKEEQAVIQEVVDLFNGQIVDIRPLRSRGAGGRGKTFQGGA